MQTITAFFGSRSGYVQPREGLAMGWIVVALLGLTMVLGTSQQASAFWPPDPTCCERMEHHSFWWACSNYNCYASSWCVEQHLERYGTGDCAVLDEQCNCPPQECGDC